MNMYFFYFFERKSIFSTNITFNCVTPIYFFSKPMAWLVVSKYVSCSLYILTLLFVSPKHASLLGKYADFPRCIHIMYRNEFVILLSYIREERHRKLSTLQLLLLTMTPYHPIVATHNTPTSISLWENSGWESVNKPSSHSVVCICVAVCILNCFIDNCKRHDFSP